MILQDLFETREAHLYHITSPDEAARIIYQNNLKGMTDHRADMIGLAGSLRADKYNRVAGVSLTRNPAFSETWLSGNGVIFVLDWAKLRQRFLMRPVDYYKGNPNQRGHASPRSEAEEYLIGNINPLDRYLVEVRIPKSVYDECVYDNEDYIDPNDSRYHFLTNYPKLRII